MRSIYISGGITGVEDYKANFQLAEEGLIYTGNFEEVANPVTIGEKITFPECIKEKDKYKVFMREDLKVLLKCTHIYMLDGWKSSRGALIEIIVAKICGIHMVFQNDRNDPGWGAILGCLLQATIRAGE